MEAVGLEPILSVDFIALHVASTFEAITMRWTLKSRMAKNQAKNGTESISVVGMDINTFNDELSVKKQLLLQKKSTKGKDEEDAP